MTEAAITVGVIANPASGRDIRRLVSSATVSDNAEKGNMVHRLLCGLGASGVDQVVMMPGADGISESLRRNLRRTTHSAQPPRLPRFKYLEQRLSHSAADTVEAVLAMRELNVEAIVVLGGDGTHRLVAKHSRRIPLCALSTGTNNAFPELREATVAGLATGLVATGRISNTSDRVPHDKAIIIRHRDGRAPDCALVDVAVSSVRWTGAGAIWSMSGISEIYVTFAKPDAIGLSAVAGLLEPVGRTEQHGLHVRLAPLGAAALVLQVPIAPGLIVPVGIASYERIEPGRTYALPQSVSSLALDGEREFELTSADEIDLELGEGPRRIDVDWVMSEAARQRVFRNRQ